MVAPPSECNLSHKDNNFEGAKCMEKAFEYDVLLMKHRREWWHSLWNEI